MRDLGSVRRVGLAGLVGVAALIAGQATAGAAPAATTTPMRESATSCTWTPRLLPQLPGGSFAEILGNDGGDTWAGSASDAAFAGHAALWRNGRIIDLGRPLGGDSRAQDVNRHGVAVGLSVDKYGRPHAVMWRHGRAVRLAEPAGIIESNATGINDTGLIVGWARIEENGSHPAHPVVWSATAPNRMHDLGTPPNTSSFINGVSERGLLVGTLTTVSTPGDTASAVAGTVRSGLHPLPSGGFLYAEALAAAGRWIVGWVFDPATGASPVRWERGRGPTALPELIYRPTGVNHRGMVIGNSDAGGVVWTRGEPTVLSGPVAGSATGAYAVADDGTVGGWSRDWSAPVPSTEPTLWSCH